MICRYEYVKYCIVFYCILLYCIAYDLLSLDRWKNQSWLVAFSGQVNGILGLGGRSQGAAFLVYRVHEQLSLGSDHFVRGDP